jgi:hypothetical protein
MPTTLTLIDDRSDAATPEVSIAAGTLGVRSRRLLGGRRDGVLLVELIAGRTRVFVLPGRGLGIWKIVSGDEELGWSSPVRGPVHPSWVPLSEPSGIGWLEGFDELVARCGLVSNGAPDFDAAGRLVHGLHGRIANLPAHEVRVVLDEATGTITLEAAVDETRFLVHSLRMRTSLVIHADRADVAWRDTVENLSDRPTTMQMLYHVNVGPPLLGPGAEVVADVEEVAPRDAAAVPDIPSWSRYAAPLGGRGEQVHFLKPRPAADGRAAAMLVAPDRQRAMKLSWLAESLPCFTLWKNQGGEADGYVTGLEPATNYPNPRSFEETQGRVVTLAPYASITFDLAIEPFAGQRVEEEAARLRSTSPPKIHAAPKPGWSRG